MGDGDMIKLGDSADLSLYEYGGNSYIKNDTGSLIIRTDALRVLNNANSEQILHGDANGAVTLYYDNAVKLATKSDGVLVTGELQATTLDINGNSHLDGTLQITGNFYAGDNDILNIGSSNDLQIYHDGSNSYIRDTGTGSLVITSPGLFIQNAAANENIIRGLEDGAVTLYYNGNAKLDTVTGGIDVTGTVVCDGGNFDGAATFNDTGADADFRVESENNANMFFIDAANDRVGIGVAPSLTTDPLQINGTGNGIYIRRDDNGTDQGFGSITFGNSVDTDLAKIFAKTSVGNNSDGNLVFQTQLDTDSTPTTRMYISSAGLVGIGTTSPSADLHLYHTDGDRPHLLLENYGNRGTGDAPILEFYLNDQTTGGIGDNTQVGVITFAGDEKDGGSKEIYGQIRGVAKDPGSGSSNKGTIDFMIQKDGSLHQTMALVNGQVGIGTGVPAAKLHIDGMGAGEQAFYIEEHRNDGISGHSALCHIDITDSVAPFAGLRIDHAGTGSALAVVDGKVSIGVLATDYKMQINGSSQTMNDGTGACLFINSTDNQTSMVMLGCAQDPNAAGIGYSRGASRLWMTAGGGSENNSTAAFCLNGAGQVGIGKIPETEWDSNWKVLQVGAGAMAATADYSQMSWSQNGKARGASSNSSWERIETGAASQYVQDAGNMYWKYASSASADVGISWTQFMASNTSGTISGDFNDTSDIGLKENITNLTGGLSIIKQLKPRNFDWKEDGKGTGVAGFVAQEVETILPKEVVGEDYNETDTEKGIGKALNVTGIVAHMAKAIQELEEKLNIREGELEQRVHELEQRLI